MRIVVANDRPRSASTVPDDPTVDTRELVTVLIVLTDIGAEADLPASVMAEARSAVHDR